MAEEVGQLVPMEGGDEEGQAQILKSDLDEFQLPFKVATLADVEQRAYITSAGCAEWLFSRVHSFCQIGTEPGKFLRSNKTSIEAELQVLQVPVEQFHYRGQDEPQAEGPGWKDHTFESRALLVMLLLVMKNRALKAPSKAKALKLLLAFAEKAFARMDCSQPFMALITSKDGILHSQELSFSSQGLCQSFAVLWGHCPGAAALWKKLQARCWLNRCIVSSPDSTSFLDCWFFVAYLYCHQKLKVLGQNIWLCFGQSFLTELLWRTGNSLCQVAVQASNDALKVLPTLRTKAGHIRKAADPVNKMLLLFKLRKEKQHRRRVAGTHDELGGKTGRMIHFENYLDCLLHLKALQAGFSGAPKQISVSWDPSTYGGKDILMGVLYHPELGRAAYLMCQHMTQTMLSEIHPSLLPSAKERKLQRLEGFKEIKGLSSALQAMNISLSDFAVPDGLILRPLSEDEYRLTGRDGSFWVKNTSTGDLLPEIPPGLDLGALPCLVSISDQGPNIVGATNYLQYSKQALLFLSVYDPFHRAWNDVKTALKASKSQAWRTVLEMTVVANLNYGPFGSSAWHFKKKARLEEFLATNSTSDPFWPKYQPLVCKERRIAEPTDFEESQDLFQSLKAMDSFATKGPLIKLMRWFSWFESMLFYDGEMWATKMVLEATESLGEVPASEQEVEERPQEHKDPQKELQALKKRQGSWKLAPKLINHKNMAVKDCIMSIGKSTWKLFAHRASEIITPDHILEYNVSCSHLGYWKQELLDIVISSLYDHRHMQHLLSEFRCHDEVLVWHGLV